MQSKSSSKKTVIDLVIGLYHLFLKIIEEYININMVFLKENTRFFIIL